MQAVYKCRLCGEEHKGAVTNNKELIRTTMLQLNFSGAPKEPLAPSIYSIHHCKNGDMGLSDFQGWRKD